MNRVSLGPFLSHSSHSEVDYCGPSRLKPDCSWNWIVVGRHCPNTLFDSAIKLARWASGMRRMIVCSGIRTVSPILISPSNQEQEFHLRTLTACYQRTALKQRSLTQLETQNDIARRLSQIGTYPDVEGQRGLSSLWENLSPVCPSIVLA